MTEQPSLTPLLTTGLNGLVGSKFKQLFTDKYRFTTLDISDPHDPIDITNYEQVLAAFSASSAKSVIHLAAFTNVTAAWEQNGDRNGLAYRVNVLGTENIVRAAEVTNKHIIHVSTAYVFDGEQTEPYRETDTVNPIEWYGQTKAEAEIRVQEANTPWTIFRIDQPFRSDPFAKTDIAHRIANGLKTDTLYPMFTNHYFGPTYIDDFARVLDWAVRTQPVDLFHATSGEQWSDFEFAQLIKKALQLPGKIEAGDLDEYLKTLNRPYQRNTALNTEKLQAVIDVPSHSIAEAVKTIKVS